MGKIWLSLAIFFFLEKRSSVPLSDIQIKMNREVLGMSAQVLKLNIADEKFSGKKALGFSLVRLGNILAGLMTGEITYFATNSLALAVAAISMGMAIKTAIGAVTDLIMGTIVNRTHTKFGKARPYVFAGILMWISLVACFAVPTSWFGGVSVETRNMALVVYITIFSTVHKKDSSSWRS